MTAAPLAGTALLATGATLAALSLLCLVNNNNHARTAEERRAMGETATEELPRLVQEDVGNGMVKTVKFRIEPAMTYK